MKTETQPIIEIDSHESHIRAVVEKHSISEKRVKFVPMSVGDVQILIGDNVIAIFERKAGLDLEKSIMDGRFEEQRARMLKLKLEQPHLIVGYIWENITNKRLDAKTITNAITHTNYYGFTVVPTQSTDATLSYLLGYLDWLKNFQNLEDKIRQESIARERVVLHKRETQPHNYLKICFLQIPEISGTTAENLALKFKTLKILFAKIKKEPRPEKLFIGVSKGISKSGLERRIGLAMSKKIYRFLTTKFTPTNQVNTLK